MIEIYRTASTSSTGFDRLNECCRDCAQLEQSKGFYVEIVKHLYNYLEEIEGNCYYLNNEETEIIYCNNCGETLVTDNTDFIEGSN